MYCPQCGQQQASNDMRFCSRCGFPLNGVMQLLAHGGVMPLDQSSAEPNKISPRRRGVQQGVALILMGILFTSLFGVFNSYLGFPEIFVALAAIIGFVGGPMRILYAAILEEGEQRVVYVNPPHQQPIAPAYQQPPAPLSAANRGSALPPHQSVPLQNWRRPDTAELVMPPSVTENTTKLLDKQDDASNPPAK